MKKVIITISSLAFIAVCFFAYIKVSDLLSPDNSNAEENNNDIEEIEPEPEVEPEEEEEEAGDNRDSISGTVTEDTLQEYKDEGLNPFGESIEVNDLSDKDIQEYIHGMSHQKIVAEKKWGFYELHPERVKWLLEGIDKSESLSHENTYKDILDRWNNEDFSSIDSDHNKIWNMQGGTVGKATGIMSTEQEQEYINSQN